MLESVYKQKMINASKWGVYSLLLLVACVFQTTPGLFRVMGIRPLLILPLVIGVAAFEDVVAGGIFGAVGGLLWDLTADRLFGFQGFLLLVYCVLLSIIIQYYLRLQLFNVFWMTAGIVVLHSLIDFYFYFSVWDYENVWLIFLQKDIPTILYTVAICPVFYGIVYFIRQKYSKYL